MCTLSKCLTIIRYRQNRLILSGNAEQYSHDSIMHTLEIFVIRFLFISLNMLSRIAFLVGSRCPSWTVAWPNTVVDANQLISYHIDILIWTLQWRQNKRDGVSNHRCPHYLLRCRSKKTSKFRVTGLCKGNSPVNGGSPPKGPVTRTMFPFDDVIMEHVRHTKGVIISATL